MTGTKDEAYTPGPKAVDISPEQDKGVLKEILREGSGSEFPGTGDKVFVHYVGKLLDGSVFDSSRDRGDLFDFELGKGSVIKAWDIGVATMKKGELAVLTCAPDYAYGASGSPPTIPPDSTLVFEVELFTWSMEDLSSKKDMGIQRRILEKGEGYKTPAEGSQVQVHLLGRYNGIVFEERDVDYPIGEGSEFQIVSGVEEGLQKFKKGEKSLLKLSPQYAFGASGSMQHSIPPNAEVEYEVTLKSFEKAMETWELSNEQRLEQAEIAKTKGTTHFKANKIELALKQYNRASSMLDMENSEEELESRRRAILLAVHLNLAMCYLKLDNCVKAIESCDKALEFDVKNEKGLFRRGQAYLAQNDFENAKRDFESVLSVDKENKAARNQLIKCQAEIKKFVEKEKQTYKNMFAKFAEQDERRNAKNGNNIESGVWENGEPKSEAQQKIDELKDVPLEMLDGSN